MMRSRFDEQLEILNRELITMGALCENTIAMAAKAITEADVKLAADIPEFAAQIERKERDIESMCLKLLLQQQPVAKDLRVISSALKMITDLERIGHQSADIAEIISMANITPCEEGSRIYDMAAAVIKMVTDSVEAFVKKDVDIAADVVAYDDVVDECFDDVKMMLIEKLGGSAANGEETLDLLMISKYFERIGDHAVNVAQWVLFSLTGDREGVIK